MSEKAQKIRNAYDQTATHYDQRYFHIQQEKIRYLLPSLSLSPASSVIDAGCGTGILFSHLPSVTLLLGIDLSLNMILEYKKKAKQKRNDLQFIVASLEALPLKPHSINTAISITVLQNLQNPKNGLQNIYNTLLPKGNLLISSLRKSIDLEKLLLLSLSCNFELVKWWETIGEDTAVLLKKQ